MVLSVPTVGEIQKDGTKIVNVYDSKNAVTRNIKVSAQEADEFVTSRTTALEKAHKKDRNITLISAALGTLGGLCVGLLNKGKANYIKGISTLGGFVIGLLPGAILEMSPSVKRVNRNLSDEFIAKNIDKEVAKN